MIGKMHRLLPHILFAGLVVLMMQPSLPGTESFIPFLVVSILIEAAVLIRHKSPAANDIGIIVFIFLILWEYITAKAGTRNAMLYPSPMVFVKDYPKILQGVGSSLLLLATAFTLALFFGVSLGLLVGLSDRLSGVVLPIVRVISPVPPIIYSPYAVALLPSFRSASVFVITITIFWSIFMSMVLGVKETDRKVLDSARTLNLNKKDMILHVLLPYALPGLMNSISVSVSTSFLVLTAAEMIGGTSGLGWYVRYHSDFASFSKVVFGIIMIGIVVTMLNVLLARLRKVLIRWK